MENKIKAVVFISFFLHAKFSFAQDCPSDKIPTTSGNTASFQKIDGQLPATKLSTSYDAKGLQPFFNLANSFMNTVQSKSFGEEFAGVDYSNIANNFDTYRQRIIDYEKPILVAVGFGVLFILLIICIGPIFCCCRCCGNCGGKMYQDPKSANKHSCCHIMAFLLLVVIIFILCGVLFMFVTNNRFHKTAQELDQTFQTAVEDVVNIANGTIQIAKGLTTVFVPCVGYLLKNDISNNSINTFIGEPLRNAVQANVSGILNRSIVEAENLNIVLSSLNNIIALKNTLVTSLKTLETELESVKNDLTDVESECRSSGITSSECDRIQSYKNQLEVTTNYSTLPDVESERDRLKGIVDSNLKQKILDAQDIITNIPTTVLSKSKDARDEATKAIDDAPVKLQNELNPIIENLESSILNKKDSFVADGRSYLSKDGDYFKYETMRWRAYVGISCVVVVIFLLLAFGLTFGACGYSKGRLPSNRKGTSTCGGNFLMSAVGIIFILSWILMIFCIVWYFVGIHLYIICRDVQDGGLIDNLAASRFKWEGKEISVGKTLKNCRNNLPLFNALNGEQYYNLTEKLDITKHTADIDSKLSSLSFDLSDQVILTADTQKTLNDSINSGLDGVNYTNFFVTIKKGITGQDLNNASAEIRQLANDIKPASTSISAKLSKIATNVSNINTVTIARIKSDLNVLEANVNDTYEKARTLKERTRELLNDLTASQHFVRVDAANLITTKVHELKDRMIGWLNQGTQFLIKEIQEDMLRCKPISNLYDGFVNTLVCKSVVMNANGFWLALGWCLLFFIPAIILSVRLAKYFRKMDYDSGYDNDVLHPPYNDKIPLQNMRAHAAQQPRPPVSTG